MRTKTIRKRAGNLLLGLLVLVLAVVIIGLVAWAIIKAISNWRPRHIDPDDVAQWTQNAEIELQANPDAHILSDGTMVQQLGSTNDIVFITVEMSTNMVDWMVRTNIPLTEFDHFLQAEPTDLPAAFYRIVTH